MHGRDGVRAHVHVTAAAIIGAANINEMIMANDARASKNLAAVLTREEEIYRSRREILMGNWRLGLDSLMVTTYEDNVRQWLWNKFCRRHTVTSLISKRWKLYDAAVASPIMVQLRH